MPQDLTLIHSLLLFSTAFIAGGLNAVAGGGSFITFPTLIFTGIAPINANATNNTALWIASIASARAYRQDLNIEKRQLLLLAGTSLVGGVIGSVALLYTSPDVFKKMLPYLLLSATLIFTFSESLKNWLQLQNKNDASAPPPLFMLLISQLLISIYGGFFGAGVGILNTQNGLSVAFHNRQGINSLSHSSSPFKRTNPADFALMRYKLEL